MVTIRLGPHNKNKQRKKKQAFKRVLHFLFFIKIKKGMKNKKSFI